MTQETLNHLWILMCGVLVLLMQAGFTCLESGLTRQKNSINVAIKNMADFGIASMLFWCFGFAIMFGSSYHGLFGTSEFFFNQHLGAMDSGKLSFYFFQTMFVAAAVTIISGAVAERVRFHAYMAIAVVVTLLIYPVVGHWVWGGALTGQTTGWLGKLGFMDFAGATVVHSVGGWVALAACLITGPRIGRFPRGKPAREITGSNIPISILGVLILWVGWLGFNGGSLYAFNNKVPQIMLNTVLAGVAGMVSSLLVEWVKRDRIKVEGVINGSLGALVGVTAASNVVTPMSAIIIGVIAGVISMLGGFLLERMKIDDVVGAIPVHGFCGVWGTLAVAIFGNPTAFHGHTVWQQLGIQATGVFSVFVWAFGLSYILLYIINKFIRLRVSTEGELKGLNVSEHGATTDIIEMFQAMEKQAETGDLTLRLKEEPFTEVGQIAKRYNKVLDRVTIETAVANRMAELAEIARQETEAAQQGLKDKMTELQEFNRIAIDRELRILALKKEVNELLEQTGKAPRFKLEEDEAKTDDEAEN